MGVDPLARHLRHELVRLEIRPWRGVGFLDIHSAGGRLVETLGREIRRTHRAGDGDIDDTGIGTDGHLDVDAAAVGAGDLDGGGVQRIEAGGPFEALDRGAAGQVPRVRADAHLVARVDQRGRHGDGGDGAGREIGAGGLAGGPGPLLGVAAEGDGEAAVDRDGMGVGRIRRRRAGAGEIRVAAELETTGVVDNSRSRRVSPDRRGFRHHRSRP
jgi:hypothetical protein